MRPISINDKLQAPRIGVAAPAGDWAPSLGMSALLRFPIGATALVALAGCASVGQSPGDVDSFVWHQVVVHTWPQCCFTSNGESIMVWEAVLIIRAPKSFHLDRPESQCIGTYSANTESLRDRAVSCLRNSGRFVRAEDVNAEFQSVQGCGKGGY
jgi:hypothetical protein